MSTTEQLDADIARANRAWTEDDVKGSAEGVAARHADPEGFAILAPSIAHNLSRPMAVVEIDRGVRKFWTKYGARFAGAWRGMTATARQFLLQTVGPDMAKTRNDREAKGQLLLIPEFVVNELSSDGDSLIRVIENVISEELPAQYFNDAQMIRRLIGQGKVAADESRRDYIAFLLGKSHVGETMKINRSRLAQLGTDYNAQFSEMIQSGFAIEGPVFSLVLERRHMLIMTLALIMDEMRTNVFDVDNPDRNEPIFVRGLQCSRSGCTNTKWTDKNGQVRPLKLCARCGGSAYCSRECQTSDWKQHKKVCGKKAAEST